MLSETATHYNEELKIWSGSKRKDFYGPQMTIGEAALISLSRCPEKVVQVMATTGEEWTAAQLQNRGKSLARNLMALGLQAGDVIGISASNSNNLCGLMLGAFLCGTPVNALYPDFDKESIAFVFKVTRPKLIFCESKNYDVIKAVVKEHNLKARIYLMSGSVEGVPNVKELFSEEEFEVEKHISFPCTNLSGDDTAAILCSSGTTGHPKGVMCSHRALLNAQIHPSLYGDHVLFTFSTMYWASGLWTFIAAILNAVKLVLTDRPFTSEYFFHLVETYKISHFMSGPHIIAQMVQKADPKETPKRLASIHTMLCGGSKVPQALSTQMNALLDGDNSKKRPGFVVTYGMSELSTLLSKNDGGSVKRRDGTEGQLMPNMTVRIVGKDGVQLGPNASGIIHISSPYAWRGYYNNAEATFKSLTDGWLVTGDIGYFDDDGYLHICARDSEVFKSNGFQIYPQQIEEVIVQLPGVLEVCVFGVPDFVAANLTACAVIRADSEAGENLTEKEVREHVEGKMSKVYHLKGGVFFVESLPMTGSGKVQRRKVLELIKNKSD